MLYSLLTRGRGISISIRSVNMRDYYMLPDHSSEQRPCLFKYQPPRMTRTRRSGGDGASASGGGGRSRSGFRRVVLAEFQSESRGEGAWGRGGTENSFAEPMWSLAAKEVGQGRKCQP
jgi:hypothetical protein